jgi:hypothetical protein
MNKSSELPRGLDPQSVMRALVRAQHSARDIAARTGTPLVVYRDGKIELVQVLTSTTPVVPDKGSFPKVGS